MVYKTKSISATMALGLSFLMILSGCRGSEQKNRSLSALPKNYTLHSSDSSIEGHYTVFDGKTSKAYFGRNLLLKGYQPLCITLTNNSNYGVHVSPESINLPTVPAEKMVHLVHQIPAIRAVGLGVPGIIGAAYIGTYSVLLTAFFGLGHIMIPVGIVGITACLSPAIVTSVKSVRTNEDIDATFEKVSLKPQTLAPGCTTSGIVFVPKKSFTPDFTITLTDGMSSQITLHS